MFLKDNVKYIWEKHSDVVRLFIGTVAYIAVLVAAWIVGGAKFFVASFFIIVLGLIFYCLLIIFKRAAGIRKSDGEFNPDFFDRWPHENKRTVEVCITGLSFPAAIYISTAKEFRNSVLCQYLKTHSLATMKSIFGEYLLKIRFYDIDKNVAEDLPTSDPGFQPAVWEHIRKAKGL